MIKVPIIFGIPKNWCIKAPLPASIIDALEIKYSVVIIPVSFPKILGLITCITSLYEFNLYKRLIFDIIIPITIYKAPHIKIPIKLLGPKEVKKLEISFPEASPAPTIVPMNTTATWNILSNSFFN